MLNKKVILGIDPGLVKTGWGVISKSGYYVKYVDCGVIKTEPSKKLEWRLSFIYDSICNLITSFKANSVAMEEVFVNTNAKTSEKLIMARTAAFLAISKSGFYVNSFRPNEIKKNITGSGHASKEQVQFMVKKLLNIDITNDNLTHTFDSMDALAVALCHAFSLSNFKNQN